MSDRNTERKREIIRRHGSENEKAMQEEIETLRQRNRSILENDKRAVDGWKLSIERGDEWKRRARVMWKAHRDPYGMEGAEWFEEE